MAYMCVFAKYFIVFMVTVWTADCDKYEQFGSKDDKLVLDAVELIDMVRQEEQQNENNSPVDQNIPLIEIHTNLTTTTEECKDEETLRARKVWSRWSKWSECSVSCGSGMMWRRRACVAGRCAPGELEEQRRPCGHTPCLQPSDSTTEESHYAD